jgi:hypothetical protein
MMEELFSILKNNQLTVEDRLFAVLPNVPRPIVEKLDEYCISIYSTPFITYEYNYKTGMYWGHDMTEEKRIEYNEYANKRLNKLISLLEAK